MFNMVEIFKNHKVNDRYREKSNIKTKKTIPELKLLTYTEEKDKHPKFFKKWVQEHPSEKEKKKSQ